MSAPIITLTSDFGSSDGYAASMKGVILGICPEATLVDISHELPPRDIPHAAFVLRTACRYFPPGAIHVAVVDPGVGTSRHPLLLVTPTGRFVAPDNGLLTYVLMAHGTGVGEETAQADEKDTFMKPLTAPVPKGCEAYLLSQDRHWLKPVSNTFHGRDIFAPVAAHLAAGVPPEELGKPLSQVVCLNVPRPIEQEGVIHGRIIYIDRFGNLISNLELGGVDEDNTTVEIGGRTIRGIRRSYAEGEGLLATIGSHGYLEVALEKGSAALQLGAKVGMPLRAALA